MSQPKTRARRAKLIERPEDFDYQAQIEKRFTKCGNVMLKMDSIGMTSSARKPYETYDSIALIQVQGVLCNEAYWWDETEYEEIKADVKFALNDADIEGIVMIYNTPGGETDNAFETADFLAESGKKKPMWASASPYSYSAGYLLMSQQKRLFVPPITGGVGSVGVYTLHFDYSEALKKNGVNVTQVSAGKGKLDRSPYKPLSKDAEAKMQVEIDRLYGEFTARVASGRGMEESAIISLGAQLFDGSRRALEAGLADRAGSWESACIALSERVAKSRISGISALADTDDDPQRVERSNPTMSGTANATDPTTAPKAAPVPAATETVDTAKLVSDATAAGYASAAEVLDICELAGKPEMAAKFIRDREPVAQVRTKLREAKASASEAAGKTDAGILHNQAADATAPKKSIAERQIERLKKEGRL